jgi:hypothetical protein
VNIANFYRKVVKRFVESEGGLPPRLPQYERFAFNCDKHECSAYYLCRAGHRLIDGPQTNSCIVMRERFKVTKYVEKKIPIAAARATEEMAVVKEASKELVAAIATKETTAAENASKRMVEILINEIQTPSVKA